MAAGGLTLVAKAKRRPKFSKRFTKSAQRAQLGKMVRFEARKLMEKKYFANTFTGGVGNVPAVHDISSIPVGNGVSQRDGDVVHPVSLKFGFQCLYGDSTNLMRVIVFQWLDTTTPGAADVLNTISSSYNLICSYHQHTKKTFKILYDKAFNLNSSGRDQYITINNVIRTSQLQKISYDASALTGYGKLYALWVSDSGVSPNPQMFWYSNIRYTDA